MKRGRGHIIIIFIIIILLWLVASIAKANANDTHKQPACSARRSEIA